MAEVGDFYIWNHLEVELTAGAYCVAQYSGSWSLYCAQITAVHSEEDTVIHCLDFGNSEHVQSKQICGQDARFSELPAQGVPCSLTQDLSVEFPSEVLDQVFQYDLDQEFKIKMKGLVDNQYVVYDVLLTFTIKLALIECLYPGTACVTICSAACCCQAIVCVPKV